MNLIPANKIYQTMKQPCGEEEDNFWFKCKEKDRRSARSHKKKYIYNQDQDILKRVIESLIETIKSIGLLSQSKAIVMILNATRI